MARATPDRHGARRGRRGRRSPTPSVGSGATRCARGSALRVEDLQRPPERARLVPQGEAERGPIAACALRILAREDDGASRSRRDPGCARAAPAGRRARRPAPIRWRRRPDRRPPRAPRPRSTTSARAARTRGASRPPAALRERLRVRVHALDRGQLAGAAEQAGARPRPRARRGSGAHRRAARRPRASPSLRSSSRSAPRRRARRRGVPSRTRRRSWSPRCSARPGRRGGAPRCA